MCFSHKHQKKTNYTKNDIVLFKCTHTLAEISLGSVSSRKIASFLLHIRKDTQFGVFLLACCVTHFKMCNWLWPRDIQMRQWNPLSLSPVYSTLTLNKGACLEVLLRFLFHPPPSPPAWLSQPPWLFHQWPPGGVPGLCLCRTRDYNKLFFWPSLVSGWTWHTMSWQIQNSCKFKMFWKSFRILNT